MKRLAYAALAVVMMAASVGCYGMRAGCGYGGCNGGCGHGNAQPAPDYSGGNAAYPYYTTRGPRDFLLGSPSGIGR